MAQYTFSTSSNELIQDIKEVQERTMGFSFSQTVEMLLLQAIKERKRQRLKNAKKVHTENNTSNSR